MERVRTLLSDAVVRAAADGCATIAIVCSAGPDSWVLRRELIDSFSAMKGLRKSEMVANGLTFRFVPWGEIPTIDFCRVLVHDAFDEEAMAWVRTRVARGCPVEEIFA